MGLWVTQAETGGKLRWGFDDDCLCMVLLYFDLVARCMYAFADWRLKMGNWRRGIRYWRIDGMR